MKRRAAVLRAAVFLALLSSGTAIAARTNGVGPGGPAGSLPTGGAAIDTRLFRYARTIPDGPAGLTSFDLDADVLAHSNLLGDLRIVDGKGREVPFLRDSLDDPLVVPLQSPRLVEERSERGRRVSQYEIELPHAGLPAAKLTFETTERLFSRTVTLKGARRVRGDFSRLSASDVLDRRSWRHEDPAAPVDVLDLHFPTLAANVVRLLVEEGNNERLPISAPTLHLPAHRIRFVREPDAGNLVLLYGNRQAVHPRYDLALVACEVEKASAAEVVLEAERPNEAAGGTPRERRVFWAVFVASIVVVLGVIGRLARAPA